MNAAVRGLVFTGLVVGTCYGQTPTTPPQRVTSPEIHGDHTVTFRIIAPKAETVQLTGEFLEAAVLLTKDESGVWSVTVGPVEPETYEYEFRVDGVPLVDIGNPAVKYNSTPGIVSSLLSVSGDEPRFFDARAVPHGAVDVRWYESASVETIRRIHVYTPPDYDEGSTRYPVLYLLHGASGDDGSWMSLGGTNLILDNLIAANEVDPMIVVMPFGYAYRPGSVDRERQRMGFARDLLEDVVPFVEANYRVVADREHRAIAGLSMGGGQALRIGLNNLDRFSHVAGFSSAVGDPSDTFVGLVANAEASNEQLRLLWLACGTDDRLFARSKQLSEFLAANGVSTRFEPPRGRIRGSSGADTCTSWHLFCFRRSEHVLEAACRRDTRVMQT